MNDTITRTRMPLKRTLEGHRALLHLIAMKRAWMGYDAHTARAAREGRAPQVCIHGRNLRVDYDIPCGVCEDGVLAHHDLYAQALAAGKADVAEFDRRRALVAPLTSGDRHLDPPQEAVKLLQAWMTEPVGKRNVPNYGWSEYLENDDPTPLVRRTYCSDVRCECR